MSKVAVHSHESVPLLLFNVAFVVIRDLFLKFWNNRIAIFTTALAFEVTSLISAVLANNIFRLLWKIIF